MSKFDLVYESILFEANGFDKIINDIEKESADLIRYLDKRLINEGVFDSLKAFAKEKTAKVVGWLLELIQKAVTGGTSLLKATIEKIYNLPFVKSIIDNLFGDFIKNNAILNGSAEVRIVTEQAANNVIFLTQEQLDEMLNKMADQGERKAKSGTCGKICGFIVDHFFSIIKILAVVAVAGIFIFKPEWGVEAFQKLMEWIKAFFKTSSEAIANGITRSKELIENLAKPFMNQQMRDDREAAALDTSKDSEIQNKGTEAKNQLLRNAIELNDERTELADASAFGQAGGYENVKKNANMGSLQSLIMSAWNDKMKSMWERDGKPVDRHGQMTSYVQNNYPEMYDLRMKYFKDAVQNASKYNDDDMRAIVAKFKGELDKASTK